jgi:adenylyltransferase/sulfurtransferase
MARFTDEEIRRYARQMVLPEVGGIGQARLRATTATASGEVEALYLAAAGIGRLTVPSREIAQAVQALNPLVEVQVHETDVDRADVESQSLRALQTLREALGL